MIFCGKILTFYLECENSYLRSQTGSLLDMTWHLQPPLTPVSCVEKTYYNIASMADTDLVQCTVW